MATGRKLVAAVCEQFRSADSKSNGHGLGEFVTVTGFYSKHAMSLLWAVALP